MKINFRGKSFVFTLRMKSKEVRCIAIMSLVFWVTMTNQGQEIDVGKLMTRLEEALPMAVQSESAAEISDTGCDVAYEVWSSTDGETPPES